MKDGAYFFFNHVPPFLLFSVSETLPTGQLSNVPWRRSGVKYTNNEAYFDVIEEVDAIIDKNGGTVSAEIHGYVRRKVDALDHSVFFCNSSFSSSRVL